MNNAYYYKLIPSYFNSGKGHWTEYQIVRRTDGALVAGGECRSRRSAEQQAKRDMARLERGEALA